MKNSYKLITVNIPKKNGQRLQQRYSNIQAYENVLSSTCHKIQIQLKWQKLEKTQIPYICKDVRPLILKHNLLEILIEFNYTTTLETIY